MHRTSTWTRTARWLLVAAWMLAIFAFSSLPGSDIPGSVVDYSPVAHFTEYAVLAGLLVFAVAPARIAARTAVLLLVVCSLYGISDEFHQSFVPGRTPDPVDWATDTAGAGAALAGVVVFRKRRDASRAPAGRAL